MRPPGGGDGLTRPQAERRFVEIQQSEESSPRRLPDAVVLTVADASAAPATASDRGVTQVVSGGL